MSLIVAYSPQLRQETEGIQVDRMVCSDAAPAQCLSSSDVLDRQILIDHEGASFEHYVMVGAETEDAASRIRSVVWTANRRMWAPSEYRPDAV